MVDHEGRPESAPEGWKPSSAIKSEPFYQHFDPPEDQQIAPITDETFHVPSSDQKGHSSRIPVKMHPLMARCIDVIISSRKFPQYKTADDLIRHAIYEHLWQCHLQEPDISRSGYAALSAAREASLEYERQKELRLMTKHLRHAIESLIADGQYNTAAGMVAKIRHYMTSIPDSSRWKQAFIASFNEATVPVLGENSRIAMKSARPSRARKDGFGSYRQDIDPAHPVHEEIRSGRLKRSAVEDL